MLLPVLGLRPVRARRCLVKKTPNPRSSIRSKTRERVGNFAEYRVNDILDVALMQMRIARDEPLHQFGLNQDNAP